MATDDSLDGHGAGWRAASVSLDGAARRAIELAARASYGRLVAVLAARSRDVAAAEDALGDAFAAALVQWPRDGVPANAEAWLVATARRRLVDGRRRAAVRDAAADDIAYAASLLETRDGVDGSTPPFPDRRLGLLFACAHPAVDGAMRTPLMLQAVLGLAARDIASAFLTSPAAMAQRLVRVKAKLRDAGIPFDIPERGELPARLGAVLDAIYAAFGTGWDAVVGGDGTAAPQADVERTTTSAPVPTGDLSEEAIWLCRLVVEAMPDEPEALGLLSLMLYCHARRDARVGDDGSYVPLHAQDPQRWSLRLIGEAEATLARAARSLTPGRYQLEAAIQSAHLAPAFGYPTDWSAVVGLYDALLVYAPTVGALVNRAAAVSARDGPAAGLVDCDAVSAPNYQPWWALRAHLLSRLGRHDEADDAYLRAAGLTQSAALRAFLLGRRSTVAGGS